jgi:hypothetical protein
VAGALVLILVAAGPTAGAGASAPPSFLAQTMAQAGSGGDIYVLGTAPCGAKKCFGLWYGAPSAGGPSHFSRVSVPVTVASKQDGVAPTGTYLVFANSRDGYLTVNTDYSGPNSRPQVFATTDGARTWRRISFGQGMGLFQMVASGNEFYAVLAQCAPNGTTCSGYSLAHSRAGSVSWSGVPFPGTMALNPNEVAVGLGASGSHVWLTYLDYPTVLLPQLVESSGGLPPFTAIPQQSLGAVTACGLTPMPGDVIWANCPTGMMVSELRSTDGGRHFTPIWSYSGTGGMSFDPVTTTLAYRFLGIESTAVQRTTDGGVHFATVGRLPAEIGNSARLLFTSPRDGFALGYAGDGSPDLVQTVDGGATWTVVSL